MAGILRSLTQGLNIVERPDWQIFVGRLNHVIQSGRVREIPVLGRPGKGYQWFLDPETGEVYAYTAPDPPVYPRWEEVDPLESGDRSDSAPLSSIKIGPTTVMTAYFLKQQIQGLVARGLVEALPTPASAHVSSDRQESWYKDTVSNVIYRLIEYFPLKGKDEFRWEVVPPAERSWKVQ